MMESPEKQGPIPGEVRAELHVDENHMQATLRLRGMPDSSFHEARIFQILNDHGIKFGADHDAIRKIVHTVQTSITPLHIEETVARGIPPTPGVDGQVRRLVRKADKVQIREDGKADFRNVKKFITVEKGQPVVEIIPPQPGTAGHNLLGEEMKPEPPAPAPRKPGKNISLVPGGHEYIARLHGIYVDDGNIVDVNPELVINGNAGLETGHIEYDGNVRILGNIERGTQVKVGGNLFVGGTIESGQLKVVGDLAVNQGINTARNGTISCHGNVKATYIENSVLVCDGDIEVSRSILTSYLITHGSIRMATGGSTLAGSEIVCFGNLEVDILGSKVGGVTRIFAGTHYKNAKQWEQSKKELEEIEQRVEQLTYRLQQYRDKVQRYRGNV
ncbi:MAG: DUF342 domain-containing protein, partial [Leptospiraceae bacterium]|nr:DUF342 domain-containing protein [Leptospiraceae bacterium]